MMNSTTNEEQQFEEEAATTCTTNNWKLYDNPFFQNTSSSSSTSQSHFHKHLVRKYSASAKHITRLHRDLKLDYPSPKIHSGTDQARTQIAQLKDELELERKMRRKAESLNKMMARELVDQRREREQIQGNLTKEVTHLKAELEKTKLLKSTDAKLFYHAHKNPRNQKKFAVVSSESCSTSSSSSNSTSMVKRVSNEVENPHIKRGIKGFVEFPRMAKGGINGSGIRVSNGRDLGMITKLECQKAQLKILLKQKSSLSSSNNVVIS